MKYRRRLIAVSLAGSLLATLSTPLDCQAGRFCDWLFRRNPSQDLAGVASPVVEQSVPGAVVTAGYAPNSTCGAAFCQQTVVRYVPQIAYRTAYQPVPVTTYKTSTSINPANGLPMTCTRPCTSYTYQAQRVPYTTYRPVYTTVPVTLPPSGGVQPASVQAPAAAPATTPNTMLYPPSYSYGYAPPTGVGCNGCQGGAASVPAAGTFTPPMQSSPGATPWTPTSPNSFGSPPTTGDPPGATPWQPVPGGGFTSPSPQDATPADLPPELPESSQRSLRPVPLPESFRDQDTLGNQVSDRVGNGGSQSRLFATPGGNDGSDSPGNNPNYGYGRRPEIQSPADPELQGPTNQNLHETRRRGFDSRAVRDLDRERREGTYNIPRSNSDDKTAAWSDTSPVPSKQMRIAREPEQVTRYTAAPISRGVDKVEPNRDNRRDPTSHDWQWRHESETTGAGWFPIR